ncbi:hypothetical protein [Rhizobium sp. Root708]|uniref:hypothetical protein n=1 Tax=Rhizobium sp. Root708 TaxID=1736592 RepID=UPI0012E343A4|nr:hypothetical protein [Rhizobium sp. Root708]
MDRACRPARTQNLVIFVKTAGSEKAAYNYDFLALPELQVDSFDRAHGLDRQVLESELAVEVRGLAK